MPDGTEGIAAAISGTRGLGDGGSVCATIMRLDPSCVRARHHPLTTHLADAHEGIGFLRLVAEDNA